MAKATDEEHAFYQVLRVAMISFVKGMSPVLAIEMARRSIPGQVRPPFVEVERACRGGGSPAPAAAA
jgi:chemotaxis protein MotA